MKIGVLARRLDGVRLTGDPGVEVTGISHDSRRVRPGWIFAALPGERAHGLDFLPGATERGAAAVLSDRGPSGGAALPWLLSRAPRRHTAEAAWALAGDPQRELTMIGITGTNGKSTTAHLLAAMFAAAGRPAGLFGTLVYHLPDADRKADRTTPEAADLAPLLARLRASGGEAAVMEISSHALALERVAGLEFDIAVWTNLSRDHLDYHHDMESYFAVKRRLFDQLREGRGRRVLPVDERWGARLLAEPEAGDVTYGLEDADVTAVEPRMSLEGTAFELRTPQGQAPVRLPLIGEHNLLNALAAAAAASAAGLPFNVVCRALESASPLPGRLEPASAGLDFPVYVDYAHTPDGLRAVLTALRRVTKRRLIVVFGAGGDRDTGKRSEMGSAVGELADTAIVTSDNPRSEDPAAIAAAVAEGVRAAGARPRVILDRREAISTALELADSHALVLVAGKGHETEQIIGKRRLPFSDIEVVRELAGGMTCG